MSHCGWYLIYTKAKQERVALLNLEQQGYSAYLPMHRVHRRSKMQRKLQTEPLFPRYLFIALSTETDDWGPIRSTRGVAKLIRFGGSPAKVPDELIALLKEQEADRFGEELSLPRFKKGDRVQIMEGVMAGYEGIFDAEAGSQRASILLGISDRYTRVHVSLDDIETR